jgi:hypothetical protein
MHGHWIRIRCPIAGSHLDDTLLQVQGVRNDGQLALAYGHGHLLVRPIDVVFVSRHSATVAYTLTFQATEQVRDWLESYGLDRNRTAWIHDGKRFIVVCRDDDYMLGAALLREMDVDPITGTITPRWPEFTVQPRRRRGRLH